MIATFLGFIRAAVLVGLAIATTTTPIAQSAGTLADGFEQLKLGETAHDAIAAMGRAPDRITAANTLGVEHAWMIWLDGGGEYSIFLLFDRIVEIKLTNDRTGDAK